MLYDATPRQVSPRNRRAVLQNVFLVVVGIFCYYSFPLFYSVWQQHVVHLPSKSSQYLSKYDATALQKSIDQCKAARSPAGPPRDFASRTRSDRSLEDALPIFIHNVTLWTGKPSSNPYDEGEILRSADIVVRDGLIADIGQNGSVRAPPASISINGQGRWMTPGIIDVHVHAGVEHTPTFKANADTNSFKNPVQPFLRVIDGDHTHDWSMVSIAAGGITTGLLLPGSGNSVGGQAFPIKFGRLGKQQAKHGSWTRVIDPPRSLVLPGEGNDNRDNLYEIHTGMKRGDNSSSWRHMKMACGENPRRIYKETRMDEAYHFRSMFDKARTLKNRQDSFCSNALKFDGNTSKVPRGGLEDIIFPNDLDLEAVVDVLRGKVKVNTHCYTMEDFTSYVSHTNEFKFPLAAFHHSHEAYLVPDLLKNVYGGTPAVALFSVNANYKVEAYFGSPFAPSILTDNGITVHLKSDHPVTDSRRLMMQVAQSHHYGFPTGAALRGVTSAAAKTLGLDHRIGQARIGFDADLVLWDRHPLSLGAEPVEVIIDGNRQTLHIDNLDSESVKNSENGRSYHNSRAPHSANYDKDIQNVKENAPSIIAWEALAFPVLKRRLYGDVLLKNVSAVYGIHRTDIAQKGNRARVIAKALSDDVDARFNVLISRERPPVICAKQDSTCFLNATRVEETIDINGGTIIPGLIAAGSTLGIFDISSEESTGDGSQDGSLKGLTARAIDGLNFGGNDLRRASASGITSVVSAPISQGLKQGIAVHFDAGAKELFEPDAIRKRQVALFLSIGHTNAGIPISMQLAQLRQKLVEATNKARHSVQTLLNDDEVIMWNHIVDGTLPLVVQAAKAELLARLVDLKRTFPTVNLVILGADESSYGSLPQQLKNADIPVLVKPIHWSTEYDQRRSVRIGGVYASDQGALNKVQQKTLLGVLHAAGVQVGVFTDEGYLASTLLWNTVEAGEKAHMSREDTLNLAIGQVASILDIPLDDVDTVAFDGDPFEYGAKPVLSATAGKIELMEV